MAILNVSGNPDTPAPVLLAYTPGRYFFSVRAVEPGGKYRPIIGQPVN